MKMKKLAAGLGLALSLVGATAHASVLRFQDDNIDFLLNADGTPKTSGEFAVGDILLSVFEIPSFTIDGNSAIPANTELTGIAAVQLTGGDGSVATPWTFAATTQGLNTWLSNPLADDTGSVIAMYFNSTLDFDLDLDFATSPEANCVSLANCLAEATAGNLIQVDGFTNDADEFWQATAAIAGAGDVATVAGTNGAITVSTFLAALTTTFNAFGPVQFQEIATGNACPAGTLAADGCIAGPVLTGPASGGAGLNAGILADGAFARSDFDISKRTVPEPGVLALLGISLMGLATTRRRRHTA